MHDTASIMLVFFFCFVMFTIAYIPLITFFILAQREVLFGRTFKKALIIVLMAAVLIVFVLATNFVFTLLQSEWLYLVGALIITIMAVVQLGLVNKETVRSIFGKNVYGRILSGILLSITILPAFLKPSSDIPFTLFWFCPVVSMFFGSLCSWWVLKSSRRTKEIILRIIFSLSLFAIAFYYADLFYKSPALTNVLVSDEQLSFESWGRDYEKAFTEAEVTGKKIFILGCSHNDRDCSNFDKKILRDDNVRPFLSRYVLLYVDKDKCPKDDDSAGVKERRDLPILIWEVCSRMEGGRIIIPVIAKTKDDEGSLVPYLKAFSPAEFIDGIKKYSDLSSAAFAWDLPTSAGGLVDSGAKVGLQTALNKKLDANKCAFKAGTADTTCDLSKVGKELAAAYNGIKQATKFNVYVNIAADDAVVGKGKKAMSGYDRANIVRDKIQAAPGVSSLTEWWHYSSNSTKNKGDNLGISVEVK